MQVSAKTAVCQASPELIKTGKTWSNTMCQIFSGRILTIANFIVKESLPPSLLIWVTFEATFFYPAQANAKFCRSFILLLQIVKGKWRLGRNTSTRSRRFKTPGFQGGHYGTRENSSALFGFIPCRSHRRDRREQDEGPRRHQGCNGEDHGNGNPDRGEEGGEDRPQGFRPFPRQAWVSPAREGGMRSPRFQVGGRALQPLRQAPRREEPRRKARRRLPEPGSEGKRNG